MTATGCSRLQPCPSPPLPAGWVLGLLVILALAVGALVYAVGRQCDRDVERRLEGGNPRRYQFDDRGRITEEDDDPLDGAP